MSALSPTARAIAEQVGAVKDGIAIVPGAHVAAVQSANVQPQADWPAWALVAALFAETGDRGVGDTIAGELGRNTEAFKRHHEALFGVWGKPCACGGQVERWNTEFPYQASAD